MNKTLKIILIVMAIMAAISTIGLRKFPYSTETATITEVRQTISGRGYILRNEKVITNDITGVFEPLVKEGERVSKGTGVGTVISGNLNEELTKELAEVSGRIKDIKSSNSIADLYEADDNRIYTVMKELAASIRECVEDRDYKTAEEHKNSFAVLAEKKYSAGSGTARDKLLVELQQRQYELEAQLGGMRSNISAEAAGFFYTMLDGLEGYGSDDVEEGITVEQIDEFENISEDYKRSDKEIGKICDSYVWYLAAVVDKKEAEQLENGKTVMLSIDKQTHVRAKVASVIHEKNVSAVVLECTRNVSGILEKRAVDFEIEIKKFSGLRVPSQSLRIKDDVPGVYVVSENDRVKFKCVEILTKEESCYVVRNEYSPPEEVEYSPLELYDNILLNPEAVE